jgi:hypothetical protein
MQNASDEEDDSARTYIYTQWRMAYPQTYGVAA